MSTIARKEIVRTAARIAAEPAEAAWVEALARSSTHGYGMASIAAYQAEDGIARLATPHDCALQMVPPPGLPPPGLSALALSATKFMPPPPGLLHPDDDTGKGTKSLASVASHMTKKDVASYINKKDAQTLSAALAPPPGLPPLQNASANAKPKSSMNGTALEELIQQSSEKYDLNMKFWGRYNNVTEMTLATEKEEILEIVENFAAIRRKQSHLFQRLKTSMIRSIDAWSAPDLAAVCHAWAQLGFKHDDLCVAMADRTTSTLHLCTAQELCWVFDAYATMRVTIPCVARAVTAETYKKVDDFSLEQLCDHASSFARLNLAVAPLFKKMGARLMHVVNEELNKSEEVEQALSAHALSLAAYSFAKLGLYQREVFDVVASGAIQVARNFTAKGLKMIMVAFAQAQHYNSDLIEALSAQVLRRLAQFNAESLTLTLRSLASFRHRDDVLLNRVVDQLPRMSSMFRPIDIVTTVNAFASLQVHNAGLFDIMTPMIAEQASLFTHSDWVNTFQGYSSLGHRDENFLKALSAHLKPASLTMQQLATLMSGCASLSFGQAAEPLAEIVITKVMRDKNQIPTHIACEMYSALALLGCTRAGSRQGPKVQALLSGLSDILGTPGVISELNVSSCLNLCYASVVAPPQDLEAHPVKVLDMLERLESEKDAFSQEDKLLLGQMQKAVELLPWNRDVLFPLCLEELADEVEPKSGHADLPLAFFSSVVGPLTPHLPSFSPTWTNGANCIDVQDGPTTPQEAIICGVHAATEVRDGLEDISAVLRMHDIQHSIVTDNLSAGAFIQTDFARFVWGSSVHYVGDADGTQRLVPAAQFQVQALQAADDGAVIVVPHSSWQMTSSKDSKSRYLLQLAEQHGLSLRLSLLYFPIRDSEQQGSL